ncbi:MAG: hypothetical protein NZ926_00020 [Candidatus Methanomethylicia archaeon]|nr:hypothetical protein [Candidatus Methanomethylicia archaeon]
MLNSGNSDIKLLDIVNLAEEKLRKVIEEIEKCKGNRRIKGLIIYHHASFDLQLNFRGGKPSLAIMKHGDEEILGKECWVKISEIMDKITGVIEVYEISEKELSIDEQKNPNAIIRCESEHKVRVFEKIEECSGKICGIPLIRHLILRGKMQLKNQMNMFESMEDIGEVIKRFITESKGKILYMFVILLDSKNWKSFEVIFKDGEAISASITHENRTLTGKSALNEILNLNKIEGGGKYTVFLYELNEEDLKLLEKDEIELKKIVDEIESSKTVLDVKARVDKPRRILMVEPVKIDLERIKARALEYFKSTLDSAGYVINELNIKLINEIILFEVKIKKKGFAIRRWSTSDVESKLIDDAQWVMKSLGYNIPVKVNLIV